MKISTIIKALEKAGLKVKKIPGERKRNCFLGGDKWICNNGVLTLSWIESQDKQGDYSGFWVRKNDYNPMIDSVEFIYPRTLKDALAIMTDNKEKQ